MNREEYDSIIEQVNPIESLVEKAAETYTKLRSHYGLSTDDGECWQGEITDYGSSYITTNWKSSWAHGGHDEGICEIPVEAILGSESDRLRFIESLVKDEDAKILAERKKQDVKETSKRKREYDALKKEFG